MQRLAGSQKGFVKSEERSQEETSGHMRTEKLWLQPDLRGVKMFLRANIEIGKTFLKLLKGSK